VIPGRTTDDRAGYGRHLFGGTAWGFGAEILALPTGILTAAFLTRTFGPAGYGMFSLAAGVVFSIQGGLNSLLSRATIRFVSQSTDPSPVATTALRLYVAASVTMMIGLWFLAPSIERGLDADGLAAALRLFSVDLPIAAVAQAHIEVLVGLGRYRVRAVARGVRWVSRLFLIVGLVSVGLGLPGAILGSVAASMCEVIVARRSARLGLRGPALPVRSLLAFGTPLFIAGVASTLIRRVDLYAFKALGADVASSGIYAAAQNLAIVPGLFSLALAPLLLASMSRALHEGRPEAASRLGLDYTRFALTAFPLAALIGGASSEVMGLIYGSDFVAGGDALATLMFSAACMVVAAIQIGMLTASDRPRWTVAIALPALAVELVAFPLLIPGGGMVGAATATLVGTGTGMCAGAVLTWLAWRVTPSPLTLLRVILVSAGSWWAAAHWATPGPMVVLKMALLVPVVFAALIGLGELDASELKELRAFLTARPGRS